MKTLLSERPRLVIALLLLGLLTSFALAQQRTGAARGAGSRQYPSTGAVGDAYFSIDPETRRVVTIADEDTTRYISQVLSNLDRPKPQVLIKVIFMEVAHNKASDIGIEGGWGNQFGGSNTGAVANAFGISGLANSIATNTPVNMFGQPVQAFQPVPPGAGVYSILGAEYQVTLRAIAQAGTGRILSRPSILARNNQPATITVGQSVPLITDVRYDTFGNAINSVRYTDVGVILRVTPFITPDNMVEMIVQPEISSIDKSITIPISAGVSAPVINVRSADTVAVTPDGQTVIIGGLMGDIKADAESKIPLLGDIPLLGNLFKRRIKSGTRTESLIFLTPHIVQAPTELAALTEVEKKKAVDRSAFTEKEMEKLLETIPSGEPTFAPPRP